MQLRRALIRTAVVVAGVVVVLLAGAALAVVAMGSGTTSLVSSGQQREYLLHIPPNYDPAKATPLVISLHGAALWPALQMKISQWNRVADEQGFIVAYPSASGFPRIWHVDRVPGLQTDVRFIADLIDTLSAQYNIDPTRIYANGMSNGGGMAFVLSCTLSDRIAAIGMVSAAQSLPWDWCTDRRPIPVITFHGTADPVIPYAGGPSPVGPAAVFPSVQGWSALWAKRNGCDPAPAVSTITPDVRLEAYADCARGATVALYTVDGGGHAWPGGMALPTWVVGRTTRSVDATALMWQFFVEHPLAAGTRVVP